MKFHELTDLALQAGKGDAEALVSLVDHTFLDVSKIVKRRAPAADSDDIQQEIWLSLMRYLPRYEGRSSFSTWFYSIVLRRIADHHRQSGREKYHNQRIATHISQNRRHTYSMQTDLVTDDILGQCPETYREILRFHLIDGLTFVEIEAKTGIRREAARSRYRRGIEWLNSNASRLGLSPC